MSQSMSERVLGKIPDDFDQMLIKACAHEPPIQRRPKISPALVIALCLILATATALAVAHSLHIIDLFGVGQINPDAVQTAVSTAIEQTGGETILGAFKVSEAFYDGIFLGFIVEGEFAEETVLIDEGWMEWADRENIAGLPGKRVGVRASATSQEVERTLHVYPPYETGGGWLMGQECFYEGEQAETLHFDLSIDLLDIDDGSLIDSTVLTFTIQRTVELDKVEFSVDAQTDFAAVDKVAVARTPLMVFATVEFRPLLRSMSGFTVVPDDGYIQKNGRDYFFGGNINMPEIIDGKGRVAYVLPVEHAQGDTLTLWISGTDHAVVINLQTGEASVNEVITHFEGEDKRIEIVEG